EPPFVAELPPAVVTTVPRDGEEVNLQAGILLRFTQPMDRDSVEQALSVSPTVTGTFTWHDDTTVSFGTKALASATRYHVALGASARAANGEPLTRDLVFAFTTVGPLTVTHTSPTDGAQGLRGDTPLLISFNYPVVPLNCTGQAASEPDCPPLPLAFSTTGLLPEEAAPEGAGMWVNSSVYRFDPEPAWMAGTTYTVTVPSSVSSADGAILASPVEFAFNTSEPQVRGISPAHRATGVPLETGIQVEFNTPMDRATTENAVTVTDALGQPVAVTATWEDEGATLVLTPTAHLALDAVYTVDVDAAAQSLSGRPLDEGESTTFTTTPPIGVLNIRRGGRDGAADRIHYYEGAQIGIEGLLDPATLEDHVEVTRNGETVEASLFWPEWEDRPTIHVNWDKVPGERDCVRVLPGLADRYGNTIDEEHVACFTVEGMPSTFTPIVRREPITLDAEEPARVYFASVNLDEVAITLSELNERDMLSHAVAPMGSVQREWTISLDGERNAAEVVSVDLADGEPLPTGYYGVGWRLPGVSYQGPQRLRVAVVDAHVLLKVSADEALVWVTDLRTAEPLVGAEVRVLSRGGAVLGRGVTDRDGIARIPIPEQEDRWEVITAAVGEPGRPGFGLARSDWSQDSGPWSFDIPYSYQNPPAYRSYLQTDRPIYRPGQEIAFRGVVRTDQDGNYGLPAPGTEVRIELQTPDRSVQDTITREVSEMGTVEGTFRLPEDAPLGGYWLVSEVVGAPESSTTIQVAVAAYRKPEFEVTVTPEQDDVLDGETARMLIEAAYYSGGVVSGARVRWTVRAEPASFSPGVGIVGRWRWGG
ncbi:MAG: Ig-like domain-containing protein, partial [Anaerolineae bacterium]